MKDEWEFDDSEEVDTMDGKQGKTEELANDDEKACDTEGDKNTNRITGEMEEENGEEIKTSSGQDSKKQEIDEVLVSSEATAKRNTTEENKDTEEKETKENNLNITGTPDSQSPLEMQTTTNTDGLSLFGVGGITNKNEQKDRTNIITSLLMELKTEEEQEHRGDNNATMNRKAVMTNTTNNNNTIAPLAT